MAHTIEQEESLVKVIRQLLNLIIGMLGALIALVIAFMYYVPAPKAKPDSEENQIVPDGNGNFTETAKQAAIDKTVDTVAYWKAPDETLLTEKEKTTVLYGRELIAHTAEYYGPSGSVFKGGTNGMNCQNCHLDAGTRVFGNNYSAVAATYPKYRARSGTVENIYKRVNDCFERSLNGRAIDSASIEMQAIVAYIKWLGKEVPKGEKPQGSGFKEMAYLDRAARPDKGKDVYVQKCQSCHQSDGAGVLNADKTAYTYPPLWGQYSYNDGAGLYRLSNLARFVKSNMPLGATHNATQLSDEEAWDVAAFVNTQPRPKMNIRKDWPKLEEKPFDHPFGPYTDGFNEAQHKLGPFQPIREKLAQLKKEKKG